jgi:hypothetical protein
MRAGGRKEGIIRQRKEKVTCIWFDGTILSLELDQGIS